MDRGQTKILIVLIQPFSKFSFSDLGLAPPRPARVSPGARRPQPAVFRPPTKPAPVSKKTNSSLGRRVEWRCCGGGGGSTLFGFTPYFDHPRTLVGGGCWSAGQFHYFIISHNYLLINPLCYYFQHQGAPSKYSILNELVG